MIGRWLDPLRTALDGVGRPVEFFFRNDDVGRDHERLWPLLELFADRGLPIDLAVIPRELGPRDAARLSETAAAAPARVGFHQHGWAHVNHETAGRKHEFGPGRPRRQQLRDIERGRQRLLELLGPHVDPVFTPPWNRCTLQTGHCLVELEFRVLSREWRAQPLDVPGLYELPVRVDWFAHRKHTRLTRPELGRFVSDAVGGPGPVGIMFHHAAMDHHERTSAGELLSLLATHPLACAHSITTLVGTPSARYLAGERTRP
jgi:peptidoglycan/xylan/chitin deacetylase (PgdA/CDA1 family)